MEVDDVGGRIGDLRLGELFGAPVRELLLFGEVDAQHLAHEILQAVLVGIGPGDPGSDLGAVQRRRHDAERAVERADVEPREMEDLQDRRIREQSLEVRGLGAGFGHLNDVRDAVAGRELHDAEPVTMRIEPHRLRVDRDRTAVARQVGQIPAVQPDGHVGLFG